MSSTISSVAQAPADFTQAVATVAHYYESEFTNPVTVTIDVGYGEIDGQRLMSGALGESETYLSQVSYANLHAALVKNLDANGNALAAANLPSSSPMGGDFWVPTAEAKALGLSTSTSIDGYAGFSNAYPFDYGNGGSVPGSEYYFLGVVAHEFSEVMGRTMMDGETFAGSAGYEPLDLFHYAAPGMPEFSGTNTGYASPDGGKSVLDYFNTNPGGDLGDWASSAGPNSFDAFSSQGVVNPVSAADVKVMNLLGWDTPASKSALVTNSAHGFDAIGGLDVVSASEGALSSDWDSNSISVLKVSAVNGSVANVGEKVAGQYGNLWLNADGSYEYSNTEPGAVAELGGVAEDIFKFTVAGSNGDTASSTLTIVILNQYDHLAVGSSNETLYAGAGNNQVLVASPGDTLVGNHYRDTFVFSSDLGHDLVHNFNTHDVIDLPVSLVPDFAALKADLTEHRHNAVISFDENDLIAFHHFSASQLHAHNFHFMV